MQVCWDTLEQDSSGTGWKRGEEGRQLEWGLEEDRASAVEGCTEQPEGQVVVEADKKKEAPLEQLEVHPVVLSRLLQRCKEVVRPLSTRVFFRAKSEYQIQVYALLVSMV
jgi:hypothetical protein